MRGAPRLGRAMLNLPLRQAYIVQLRARTIDSNMNAKAVRQQRNRHPCDAKTAPAKWVSLTLALTQMSTGIGKAH
jgi:hypothetical protein